MGHHLKKIAALWAATALLGFCCLSLMLHVPIALAEIRPQEEAPGQIVYQTRQTVQDQYGDRWQVIAFKRIETEEHSRFTLRLVSFPGKVDIDHTQPLTLTTSLGQSFSAPDVSNQIFTDALVPDPNIAQYDLQKVVLQLPVAIPVQLSLPLYSSDSIRVSINPALIREWQTLAALT